mgnify:CR=1 FL=1
MKKPTKKLSFNDLSNPWQRFRSQTGISQAQRAELLKVGQPAVSGYEAGDFPHPDTAKRFVEIARKHKIRMSMEEVYARLEV